jgi:allantoinase
VKRSKGMDHDLYPYSAIIERPSFRLEGHKIGVCIVLHVEHYELQAPKDSYRDPRFSGEFGTFDPEFRNWTARDYGNRVGIYRIIDLLDQMGIAPTVALGAAVTQVHPELVEEIRSRGWEIAAHGFSSNRMITSRMSESEERDFIVECRRQIVAATGTEPEGWLGQDYGGTERTPSLLAEAGFLYTLDWSNDDQPYWLKAGDKAQGIVSVPAPAELDDVQNIWLRRIAPDSFPGLCREMLNGLSRTRSTRVLSLGVHPWVFGAPHRIRYLKQTLEVLQNYPGALVTTASHIAHEYKTQSTEEY